MTPIQELAHLTDVPTEVEVELGRKIMSIAEILSLDADSIIQIPRSAGEKIDILVAGTLIGYGEIVIIEDTVGVRITDFSHEE